MKIRVDPDLCSGQARCNAASPRMFQLDDEGYNNSDDYEVAEDELADASRGVLACPERAITLVGSDGEAVTEAQLLHIAGLSAGH